jgi:hypothetical protein
MISQTEILTREAGGTGTSAAANRVHSDENSSQQSSLSLFVDLVKEGETKNACGGGQAFGGHQILKSILKVTRTFWWDSPLENNSNCASAHLAAGGVISSTTTDHIWESLKRPLGHSTSITFAHILALTVQQRPYFAHEHHFFHNERPPMRITHPCSCPPASRAPPFSSPLQPLSSSPSL